MEIFIKVYVLISLWFWAGMLLSSPLRREFGEMHWRLVERIYDATFGQVEKAFYKIVAWFSQKFEKAAHSMENRTYDLRVKVARKLVKKELLEELNYRNLVAAIAEAKQMNQHNSGMPCVDIEALVFLVSGDPVGRGTKRAAVKTAFDICHTDMFKQIITKIPLAQERILLAFDQAEGDDPYDSVKNEEYRKFIRE